MKLFHITVTKICESRNYQRADGSHELWCECSGTKETLTEEGRKLISFLRKHADFANKEHGHSIS